jgi:Zn finger protein HypA/HybF involved in hydrogenase expression
MNWVDEADLIALVMQKALKMYKSEIAAQELQLGNRLTLMDLESAMDKLYCIMDNDIEGSGNKLQLSPFTCKCYKCKKLGHMAKDCKSSGKPTISSNSSKDKKMFTGKCFNCGKSGHKLADCLQKEENKHKSPKGYSPSGASKEAGAAAVDNNSKVEFLLCGFTTENLKSFPDNQAC